MLANILKPPDFQKKKLLQMIVCRNFAVNSDNINV